jgi:hypothetical protein
MEADLEDLIDHLVDHLCAEQAETVAELPDAEIRRRAALALRRAESHGFTEPRAMTAFATLMFIVAPDFDAQPKIAAALQAKGRDDERMRLLFARTSEEDWDEAGEKSKGWPGLG